MGLPLFVPPKERFSFVGEAFAYQPREPSPPNLPGQEQTSRNNGIRDPEPMERYLRMRRERDRRRAELFRQRPDSDSQDNPSAIEGNTQETRNISDILRAASMYDQPNPHTRTNIRRPSTAAAPSAPRHLLSPTRDMEDSDNSSNSSMPSLVEAIDRPRYIDTSHRGSRNAWNPSNTTRTLQQLWESTLASMLASPRPLLSPTADLEDSDNSPDSSLPSLVAHRGESPRYIDTSHRENRNVGTPPNITRTVHQASTSTVANMDTSLEMPMSRLLGPPPRRRRNPGPMPDLTNYIRGLRDNPPRDDDHDPRYGPPPVGEYYRAAGTYSPEPTSPTLPSPTPSMVSRTLWPEEEEREDSLSPALPRSLSSQVTPNLQPPMPTWISLARGISRRPEERGVGDSSSPISPRPLRSQATPILQPQRPADESLPYFTTIPAPAIDPGTQLSE